MNEDARDVILIVDSSMWIDLFQFDLLDHVILLPYQIRVPDFVWEELISPLSEDLDGFGISIDSFSIDEVTEIQGIRSERSGLSVPDASNIVLGLRYVRGTKVVYLAAHDTKLRQEAERRGLPCKDALELLDEMVSAGQIERVEASRIAPDLARGKKTVNQARVTSLISKWLGNKSCET